MTSMTIGNKTRMLTNKIHAPIVEWKIWKYCQPCLRLEGCLNRSMFLTLVLVASDVNIKSSVCQFSKSQQKIIDTFCKMVFVL